MLRIRATGLEKARFVCFQDLSEERGEKGWWRGLIWCVECFQMIELIVVVLMS